MDTRTQLRAVCPICFRDHAVRFSVRAADENSAIMVQHGYQRPEGWHQNVGECSGTGQPHFGTKRGRVVAAGNAVTIRRWAQGQRDSAQTYRTKPPATIMIDGKRIPNERRYEQIKIDATDHHYQREIDSRISHCEMQAKHADQSAAEIEKRVKEWKPVAPREEKVQAGPTIHVAFKWYPTRIGCRYSFGWASNRPTFHSSADWSKVTCTRCLAKRNELAQAAVRFEEQAKARAAATQGRTS